MYDVSSRTQWRRRTPAAPGDGRGTRSGGCCCVALRGGQDRTATDLHKKVFKLQIPEILSGADRLMSAQSSGTGPLDRSEPVAPPVNAVSSLSEGTRGLPAPAKEGRWPQQQRGYQFNAASSTGGRPVAAARRRRAERLRRRHPSRAMPRRRRPEAIRARCQRAAAPASRLSATPPRRRSRVLPTTGCLSGRRLGGARARCESGSQNCRRSTPSARRCSRA